MIIKDILNERISDIVYHFTKPKFAMDIIVDDQFKLAAVFRSGSEVKLPETGLFFLSTTRSKQGEYHLNSDYGVMFELDGRKINQNYKGGAVDYWQRTHENEMEDRIIAPTPTIPALKYISRASILIDPSDAKWGDENIEFTRLFDFWKMAKSKGIPVAMFDRMKNLTLNRDPLTTREIKFFWKAMYKKTKMRHGGQDIKFDRPTLKYLPDFVEILTTKDVNKLSGSADAMFAKIVNGGHFGIVKGVEGELKNYPHIGITNRIGEFIKKYNVSNIHELIKRIQGRHQDES